MIFKKAYRLVIFMLIPIWMAGCATTPPYLKGVSPDGELVYLGTQAIETTTAFKNYLTSSRSEADKQNYLFERIKEAPDLVYIRDGYEYNWLQAYRGGKWLIRNRYEKGMDARTFAKKHVWKSEVRGNPHLVKYPDGSIHVGYYVLLNELDLFERKLAANP